MMTFSRLFRPIVKAPPFPNTLNECTDPEHIRRGKKNYYGVHGWTTELCQFCVADREKEFEGAPNARLKALETFTPDTTGYPSKP